MGDKQNDPINPNHYRGLFATRDIQCIALTRQLDFDLGNYAKYIYRCGNKDDARQDFDKAKWYAEDWISSHRPHYPMMESIMKFLSGKDLLASADDMPYKNRCAEKARIAFDFIQPPQDETSELFFRYHLLKIVTEPFIVPVMWRLMLSAYENKYLGKDTTR